MPLFCFSELIFSLPPMLSYFRARYYFVFISSRHCFHSFTFIAFTPPFIEGCCWWLCITLSTLLIWYFHYYAIFDYILPCFRRFSIIDGTYFRLSFIAIDFLIDIYHACWHLFYFASSRLLWCFISAGFLPASSRHTLHATPLPS